MPVIVTRRLDKVVASAGTFAQISQKTWDFGIAEIAERPAGELTATFRGVESQKPIVRFSTTDLRTALSAIGTIGADLGQTDTWYKATAKTGNVARGTASHELIRIEDCLAYITNIRLTNRGKSTADIVLCAGYDGVNEPFQYTASVALSGTHGLASLWGVGPCAVNGSNVSAIQEINIATGVNLVRESAESEIYDTFIGIDMTDPVITLQTKHSMNWSALGLNGVDLDGVNGLEFFARKRGGQGPKSDATLEHIYFQGLTGIAVPVDSSGQEVESISDQLRISLTSSDGSSAALTGAIDQAIT